ncbi:hypothetical protein EUX98_g8961 [Antrodiella citrinella]|uniref:Uncharacterized protein n=1 Tax=Antrodiella citrinella TaxID=2447956 RepID=A0A4S4M0H1_9APHY|nr:hypothetical protein EUX98_g8961 [Antrodiella citrinella]
MTTAANLLARILSRGGYSNPILAPRMCNTPVDLMESDDKRSNGSIDALSRASSSEPHEVIGAGTGYVSGWMRQRARAKSSAELPSFDLHSDDDEVLSSDWWYDEWVVQTITVVNVEVVAPRPIKMARPPFMETDFVANNDESQWS